MKARKIVSAYAFVDETTKEEFTLHVVHFPKCPARMDIEIMTNEKDEYDNRIVKTISFDLSNFQAEEIAEVLSSKE